MTLIETLGWDGQQFGRLSLHLARLRRSAARLGWRCAGAEAALRAAARPHPARLRLTLDASGQMDVTATPLPPAKPLWRLGLAPQRLTSDDPWLTLKSSHRPAYDAARAELPDGLDEVILQNELGEVCDGTITTLFFDRGQGMQTPPLACGVLPGVLRAEMALPEAVLMVGDLPKVRLWIGNSLRGLIPAVWVG